MPDSLHPLTVVALNQQADSESAQLVLQDDLERTFEIPIGVCEALAIQLALNGRTYERPLTHDLLLSLADHLETAVRRLIIDDVSKRTFFARLIIEGPDGELSLDCRPSDGIAVALRAKIPMLATDAVILGKSNEN